MEEVTTLKTGLSFDKVDLEQAIETGKEQIEAAAHGGLAGLSWPLVKSRLADEIARQVDSNGIAWFFGAWSLAQTLRGYKDKEQYPPDKQVFLKLGKHKLSGTLEPCFSIQYEGAELAKISFEVEMTANLNAVTLAIRDGRITGFGGGDCAIDVQLRYDKKDIGNKLTLKEFKLPGDYPFDPPGIAIP